MNKNYLSSVKRCNWKINWMKWKHLKVCICIGTKHEQIDWETIKTFLFCLGQPIQFALLLFLMLNTFPKSLFISLKWMINMLWIEKLKMLSLNGTKQDDKHWKLRIFLFENFKGNKMVIEGCYFFIWKRAKGWGPWGSQSILIFAMANFIICNIKNFLLWHHAKTTWDLHPILCSWMHFLRQPQLDRNRTVCVWIQMKSKIDFHVLMNEICFVFKFNDCLVCKLFK